MCEECPQLLWGVECQDQHTRRQHLQSEVGRAAQTKVRKQALFSASVRMYLKFNGLETLGTYIKSYNYGLREK